MDRGSYLECESIFRDNINNLEWIHFCLNCDRRFFDPFQSRMMRLDLKMNGDISFKPFPYPEIRNFSSTVAKK